MARDYAIAAVGKAILLVLAAALPKPDFTGAKLDLYQSKNLQDHADEGIGLYLYRVTPSGMRPGQPRVASGKTYLPSIAVDLHYLLIAYARDAFKQQRLLGWAMRALEDSRVLRASVLNQYGPEHDIFADTDCFDLSLETVSIQDLGAIWDTAKPEVQPCATYVVRMVPLDSTVEMAEAERVQTRVIDAGTVVAS